MKPVLLALALSLAVAPLAVAHAEGNGPAFPGLQNLDVGITTPTNGSGQGRVVITTNHSSNDDSIGQGSWNSTPKAPRGLTPAQLAQRAHTWEMLDANSGGAG